MENRAFVRCAGGALVSGAVLLFIAGACLTPFLPDLPIAQSFASPLFIWHRAISAAAAALILLGSIGLYLRQQEKGGRFSEGSFFAAFFGTALVLAVKWNDVFFAGDVARTAPAALEALNAEHHPDLYGIGSTVPIVVFFIGWIMLAAASLRARVLSRVGSILVIVGLCLFPFLAKLSAGMWGPILGSACLSVGLFWLGYAMRTEGPAKSIPA